MSYSSSVVPDCFLCPITREIMVDPVNLATDCGHAFDRASARDCLSKGHKACPVCRRPLRNYTFVPNHPLREAIEHFERSRKEREEDEKAKAKAGAAAAAAAADEKAVDDEAREPQNENSRASANDNGGEVRSTREAAEKPTKVFVSPAVHKPPKTKTAVAATASPAVTKPPRVMTVAVTKPPRSTASNSSRMSPSVRKKGGSDPLSTPIAFGRTYTL